MLICNFPLQRPYPWNIISPSGEWKWTLVDANRRALASWRVKASASDGWAWPTHETIFFAISNCKYCENFTLKTLRARLVVFDRESSVLPCRVAPEASFLRETAAWSSDTELEAMEIEQFSLSLPPSPGFHRTNSLVVVVLHPARRHGMPFPSGWRIFYMPRPLTLRTLGPHHLTFSSASPSLVEP